MSKLVLGIDIGFDKCGYALLEYTEGKVRSGNLQLPDIISAGYITSAKQRSISERITILFNDLSQIVKKYKPDIVGIEKLYFYRKNTVFEKVCMAKGVALLAFQKNKVKVIEMEPKLIKKYVTGNGNAEKKIVKQAVAKILKLDLKLIIDDTIDAVSIGMCAYEFDKYDKMIA